jgi:hypothetical protein
VPADERFRDDQTFDEAYQNSQNSIVFSGQRIPDRKTISF